MRETQAWPRGAEEDAPTSLDPVRPPVQRQLPTVPLDNSRHAALARTLEVGVVQLRNPERAAQKRGLWADVNFLEKVGSPEFAKTLKHTQFADCHSHGWIFRAMDETHSRDELRLGFGNVHDPLDAPLFAPIMVAVTFEAAPFGGLARRTCLFVAFPA
jgi:hypothetical protein